MSKGGRSLSEDEKKLWRRVAASAKPRRGAVLDVPAPSVGAARPPKARVAVSHPRAKPQPKKQSAAPPPNRGSEKRVRRGKLEIGATLDLHGHNQETGRSALLRFLHRAHARGDRTVIVITGVGRTGQGVLRQRLPEWLAESEFRQLVSGFAQAHRAHGGAGAYYVFLKARRSD